MIELNAKQRKFLEKNAQPMNALVQVGGAGLTDEQIKHIKNVLASHELIKVKYNVIKSLAGASERSEIKESRNELDNEIEEKTNSTHVRTIGNVAIFYRAAEKPEDREYEKGLLKLSK